MLSNELTLTQVRESFIYAQLAARGLPTNAIGRTYGAAFDRWLAQCDAATEAAVRADERKVNIEKDAAIVEGNLGRNWVIRGTPRDVAAAIRAQLDGEN